MCERCHRMLHRMLRLLHWQSHFSCSHVVRRLRDVAATLQHQRCMNQDLEGRVIAVSSYLVLAGRAHLVSDTTQAGPNSYLKSLLLQQNIKCTVGWTTTVTDEVEDGTCSHMFNISHQRCMQAEGRSCRSVYRAIIKCSSNN